MAKSIIRNTIAIAQRKDRRVLRKTMSGIIDFHSHILPCVDDGSASLEESLALLRTEAEQGIEHVIATPHFYAKYDTPKWFLQRRAEAETCLRDAMAENSGLPRVTVGAEVYFFSGMSDSDELLKLTIGNDQCIMLEMPHSPWTANMYKELENIYVKQGLMPVIAHVDRYIRPFQTHGIPERLQDLPVLVQANASFFLDRFTRGMALRLLREDKIQLLGSDCHNMVSRVPNLGQALQVIKSRVSSEIIDRILSYQESALPNQITIVH